MCFSWWCLHTRYPALHRWQLCLLVSATLWGPEFTPSARHPAGLVPCRSFVFCCLRRGVSRCEHRSKESRGPGLSQGQCFRRKTERSRGARGGAGRSGQGAWWGGGGDRASLGAAPLQLRDTPSLAVIHVLSSPPSRPSSGAPAHPHPFPSLFLTVLSQGAPITTRVRACLSLLSSNPPLASILKPDSDDLTPCLRPGFLPHPPLLTLLQPQGPPFCS